jgi:hypothetical protein
MKNKSKGLIVCSLILLLQISISCNIKSDTVIIEAESFVNQTDTLVRKWIIRSDANIQGDTSSVFWNASKHSFIEIVPDTRVTHEDSLIQDENFCDKAGFMAVVTYNVNIKTPGKYFVWVRALSSGTEDNGVHVGINGKWPLSGERMQWCEGKNSWTWASKQRTPNNHCGEEQLIYLDIPTAGEHTISFSMREDGFKMDKFLLSKSYRNPEINIE